MRVGFGGGNCCFGERGQYGAAPSPYVGLSGIAKQHGWTASGVLSIDEQAAAGSWAGYLGAAKLIALANGLSWSGPPSWATTQLYVGQRLLIPGRLSGGDDTLYTVTSDNVSGSSTEPIASGASAGISTTVKVVGGLLGAGLLAAVAFGGKGR